MFYLNLEQIFTQTALKETTKRLKHSSLGLDGLDILDICNEKFYNELIGEILSQTYIPTPQKQLLIPKENRDSLRQIAIPSLRDKLAQNLLATNLSRYFDKKFSNCSYAYRQGKSYKNAIFRARDFMKIYTHIIKSDIKDFFESIDHKLLLDILYHEISDKRILRLIELWVKNGIFNRTNYIAHHQGVHQGDVLSPLLSNIYLNQMDQFLQTNKADFIRYADDFVVFANDENHAISILDKLRNFLLSIKLNLNESKTKIYTKEDEFTFLGVNFKGANLSISDEKFHSTISKLSAQTKVADISTAITNFNAHINSIKRFKFQLFSPAQKSEFTQQYDEIITNLVRKFLKTISKQNIINELERLEFIQPLSNTHKKQKLSAYCKNAKTPRIKSVATAIESKKRQYLQSLAHSNILHITTPYLFLGLSQGKFVLRQNGKIIDKFPIIHITHIIINTQISLSSAIIKECAKRKIAIEFIDEKTNLSYATILSANHSMPKTAIAQLSLLKTKKSLRIAQQFITGKLKNQINYLKYLNKYHKNITQNITTMQEILDTKVKFAKSTNELMGYEGIAANAYWQALATIIENKFNFTSRITKGATDIINSALNYAYAILYSKILKAIVSAGLSPHISYLHALDDQKPTLAFDLIEEFRSFMVDRTIISMINKNEPFIANDGLLDITTRQNITKNINERFFAYTNYRGEQLKGEDIIAHQAYALKNAITQNTKYKPFIGRFQ